jgi:inner membrane protein
MPTILSHPAVPLALSLGLGGDVISKRLLIVGALGSILPDMDVLAFTFGIPYEHELGHRGMTHSFVFAALVALMGACAKRILHTTFVRALFFLFVATGSHGILDAFTDGGLGVAFFWPWSERRFFAPFQPIRVAPIGISDFIPHARGVLFSELSWVWIPCALASGALMVCRKRFLARV